MVLQTLIPTLFPYTTLYGEKTGEWFDGQDLGYGIPAGTMVAGDEYEIVLIGHDPDGVSINRDMRVQLHEIGQDYELGELIMEEDIHVEEITGTDEIYTNNLPEEENVSYVISLEVLDDANGVEDTLVGLIYVPEQEVNAELSLDRDVFEYVRSE